MDKVKSYFRYVEIVGRIMSYSRCQHVSRYGNQCRRIAIYQDKCAKHYKWQHETRKPEL